MVERFGLSQDDLKAWANRDKAPEQRDDYESLAALQDDYDRLLVWTINRDNFLLANQANPLAQRAYALHGIVYAGAKKRLLATRQRLFNV